MKPIGSGSFGRWTEGAQGVPAYLYECDQRTEPTALTMTNKAWNDRRNHTFAFGNDRITATASNFGYCQLRQDEGGAKYLTDHDPKHLQFGGGFGYLQGQELLCTYYNGGEMAREYGAGYMRKVTKNAQVAVEELLFAPYGNDPLILKKVTVTNNGDAAQEFQWYDYWSGAMHQLSFTLYCLAQVTMRTANAAAFRRRFDKSFAKRLEQFPGGVTMAREFKSEGLALKAGQGLAQAIFRNFAKRFYDNKDNAGMDYAPPKVAAFALDGEPVQVHTDAARFFGKGGVMHPDFFSETNPKLNQSKTDMLLLNRGFSLEPGESKTLWFAYAYEPAGFSLPALVETYRNLDPDALFYETLEHWKHDRVAVDLPGEEWADRELLWHNACLRGSMSYAEYFGAHVLSQGGHYQYCMGLQGAPRDQLQHSLSFIHTDPQIAREHILFTLREMSPEGELPYATHGNGMMIASVMVPSDLQLMLLSYAGEYILATRDYDFLQTTYTSHLDGDKTERTVLEGILLAYHYAQTAVGRGEHGLVRMRTGDWNDQAVYGRVPFTKTKYAQKHGESMLNSAMACYSFRVFGDMLAAIGEEERAAESLTWANEIRAAVATQWTGKWFRRAFLGKKIGWLGEDLLWLEPQPWALISGACPPERAVILAENIRELLDNPNGASLISHNPEKREDSAGLDAGVLENGGIWPAINGYLVWGLAKVNGAWAYEEWLKNSRCAQAEAYPDIWYGIWSGPDSVNAGYAEYPGRTQNSRNPVTGKREKFFKLTVGVDWEDYPALNLHAHTWQQYTIFKLLGLEFSAQGLSFAPVIPKERYKVTSPLLDFEKDGDTYIISYRPLRAIPLELSLTTEQDAQTMQIEAPFEKLTLTV